MSSLETLSRVEEKGSASLETLTKANYGALSTIDKQADIVQAVEIVRADKLFELAAPNLNALAIPASDISGARFWDLLVMLTDSKKVVPEGIPGIRELWREAERYAGVTSRSQYNVDPSFVREDLKYRLLTQLSENTPTEVAYILSGSTAGEFMGQDATKFATRQTFLRRVIRNSARTVMRQSRKSISLDHLDRESEDTRTPEEINAQVFGKGSIFNPRPFAAHKPLGKVDVPITDLIDGSNGLVDPIVRGLGVFWVRVAYLASAPKYDPATLKRNLERASQHYLHEINMLAASDAATYPEGGPAKTPADVKEGNTLQFTVRWMLQTRARYANRTMVPYLGTEGYTRAITKIDRDVMIQMQRQAIKAYAHSLAGRVYFDASQAKWKDSAFLKWNEFNRGIMRNDQWRFKLDEVPKTTERVVTKEISKAISSPKSLLADTPATKPQRPKTPKEMESLDTVKTGSSLKELAKLRKPEDLVEQMIQFGTAAEWIEKLTGVKIPK